MSPDRRKEPPFDALLLAGGASSRMGRDKALLPIGDGRVLWQRQLDVLERLDPGRLFVSGPERAGFSPEVRVLRDSTPGLGPLSGLVEGLRVTDAPLLVVLAVDLPAMTSAYLASLLENCAPGRGCVARLGRWFEPLAAVYPREALLFAEEALAGEDRSLQGLAHRLLEQKLISVEEVGQASQDLFLNWNSGELPQGNPRVRSGGWKDFPIG